MSSVGKGLAGLAVLACLTAAAPAADVKVIKKVAGVPVRVEVTLSKGEVDAFATGANVNIPKLPKSFVKPLRKLATKMKAADQGNGVKVTLWVSLRNPRKPIKDKVEAR